MKPKKNNFVEVNLCGVPLNVLPGAVRTKVDQDDTWWFYLTKHHNIIYDVGCNIGYTALLALIQDTNKQIVLVDPNPVALQHAAMNIINNGLGRRVQYLTAFVGDKLDDTVKFYTVGSGAAGSMYASHAETASAMNSFMDVNTITLDYMYDFYGIKPDLVKIDVEGAETLVMKAATKLAKETKCTFFIEMHNVENLGMEAAGDLMVQWCNENDYKAWYLKTQEVLSSGTPIATRGKCHLLLLPKDAAYPEYLKAVVQNSPLPNHI
ncbi:FkbM family methyltransferase [Psychroserpens ponticola]|uniref:FkbM family methyltransferase n=1 Tax=Psychroserpens ponticola TaxID=2932268 RepID=A0ABY7S0K6_9FLAO|nr:FkbM family methyltransferase [Psychroserpens ponticola]WCO02537.1 FkbM family methyltransferase [Psychroserpens ponticola]